MNKAEVLVPVYQMDSALISALCITVLKHILFIREQIPIPFETLVNYEQLSTYRPSLRKMENFINHFTSFEEELNTICSLADVAEIQLLFGPSLTSPKEVYALYFPFPVDKANAGEIISEKAHRECLRRTIRRYIHHWGEADCRPLTPSNIFVAIRLHDSETPFDISGVLVHTPSFGHRQLARSGLATKTKRRSTPPDHLSFVCKEWEESGSLVDCNEPLTSTAPLSSSQHSDDGRLDLTENRGKVESPASVSTCASDTLEVGQQQQQQQVTWLVLKRGIKGLKSIRLNC